MSWWGKALGGAFGFMLGGPLGALLGAVLGHNLDKGLGRLEHDATGGFGGFEPGDQERVQTAFFTTTFAVMGHLAKADGRVSREEVQAAEAVMERMDLDVEMRRTAIGLFHEGKEPGFPLDEVLNQFRREAHRRGTLVRLFVEIQLQAAYADGVLHPSEEQLLRHICQVLGFPLVELERLKAALEAAYRSVSGSSVTRLEDAYAVLGVSPKASDAEVKRAYRRLMNQHHPDKLVAKGLPDEMVKVATEKSQTIRAAYDQVRKARGR